MDLEKALRKETQNRILIHNGLPPLPNHICGAHMSLDFIKQVEELNTLHGSPLEIDIELIQVESPNQVVKEPWEMDNSSKLKQAIQSKLQGNQSYKEQDFKTALSLYTRAISLLESLISSHEIQDLKRDLKLHQQNVKRREALQKRDVLRLQKGLLDPSKAVVVDPIDPPFLIKKQEIDLQELDKLEMECRSNYAATQLKLKNYPPVIHQCTAVLEKDPNHLKSYFRRGQAYYFLGKELNLAKKDFNSFRNLLTSQSLPETCHEYIELKRMEKLIQTKESLESIQTLGFYSNLSKNSSHSKDEKFESNSCL